MSTSKLSPNPKWSSCSCYFVPSRLPTLESSGLPYKTCKKCKNTEKKWRTENKEYVKVCSEIYREENKEKVAESKKAYNQQPQVKQKQKENAEEKIPCECGMFIRRDWLSRHQTSLQHLDRMEFLWLRNLWSTRQP